MHSLHCIDVARTLRQVCASDVPQPQKAWAPESYKAAVTKLKTLNERGLRLAESIDEYAEAWNAFIQHGDEYCLRELSFTRTVNDIANANEKIITDIRKNLKSSIKENGLTITRHSGDPGQECKLRCAQVIPESRETRQIREQILGWSMKDYCYHHPLKAFLSKSSLRWKQLEYATSLLKLLLLAQVHAEHLYTGQSLDVKVERHRQLEAMQDLGTRRQQLRSREQNETNTSLHYGDPIGILTVSNLHRLPLSIAVSHWFKPQQVLSNTAQSQDEATNVITQARMQQTIRSSVGISLEETARLVDELNTLKIQHSSLMQKTNDIVARLSNSTVNRTAQNGPQYATTYLTDIIHNYVFSKTTGPGFRGDEVSTTTARRSFSQQVNSIELDGTSKHEISGSCRQHPIEKPIETPSQSRRSSVWGLEDARAVQQTFDLAELENHHMLSLRPQSDIQYKNSDTGDVSSDRCLERALSNET